jgi:hypothetical protein
MEHAQRGPFIFIVSVSGCLGYSLLRGAMTSSFSECKTNYHNNFSVRTGIRTYYGGVPDLIQVGEHQFIERELISSWVDLMLTAWLVPSHS